jgi:hypothetical protein
MLIRAAAVVSSLSARNPRGARMNLANAVSAASPRSRRRITSSMSVSNCSNPLKIRSSFVRK